MELVVGYLVLFLALVVVGVPIAFSLGVATLSVFLASGAPVGLIPPKDVERHQRVSPGGHTAFHLRRANSCPPGGILVRILDLARLLVGRLKGGLYHVNILISMLFGGLNGSAVADTSAVGSLLIPPTTDEYGDPDLAAGRDRLQFRSGADNPAQHPQCWFTPLWGEVSVSEMFRAPAWCQAC